MKPQGGTELLYKNLIKYVGLDWQKNVNLILSICNTSLIDPSKINVMWQHLMTDQYNTFEMYNNEFTKLINSFIYVSNWQLQQFQEKYNIQNYNNVVIKNAIDPIEFIPKTTDKIRLIYTSMPNRGLEILLDSFEILNRDDVELVIYSSNIIYGKNYFNSVNHEYEKLFHRCKTMKNVVYKGFAMNNVIRKELQKSHILAYPSIYEETSCLAAIEAGSAGCKIVTTNYGALSETCSNWATYVDYTTNKQELANNYAKILNDEINNYNDYQLKEQSEWFNETYSWQNRKIEWQQFFKGLI